MRSRVLWHAAALMFILCGLSAGRYAVVDGALAVTPDNGGARTVSDAAAGSGQNPVYLYFAGTDGRFLTGEASDIEAGGDTAAFCRRMINALIEGPESDLLPTIPGKTKLRAVYLDNGQTAYVDLSRQVAEAHPGGVRCELLTVYSIVNSLILNVDGVEQVKILIDGSEARTLAGHVDIDHPNKAQMLLVR